MMAKWAVRGQGSVQKVYHDAVNVNRLRVESNIKCVIANLQLKNIRYNSRSQWP